jgi:pimeloyl-ACP methyl ester carboxylesterase
MNQAIIIIGGYNSLWTAYLKLARELEDLTGLLAVGVPLMPWHWWSATRAENAGNILQKLESTVGWARRRHGVESFILVGHSAGGLVARLYLCEEPVWGQATNGLEHVTGLVSLGSPHCSQKGAKAGWFLTAEANRLAPGATYAHSVDYLAVAGRYLRGDQRGGWRERRAFRSYAIFGGRGDVWGDGAVPLDCAHLAGAHAVTLEGVAHSSKYGSNWYGASKSIIRRWWPDWVRRDH